MLPSPWQVVTSGRVGCAARSRIRVMRAFSGAASLRTRRASFRCTGLSSDLCRVRGRVLSAALAENAKYHFGFLHYAFLMVPSRSSPVPLHPVIRLSRSPDWSGRYPADYCGHSVAIGLASRRRSHVHHCCTCRARFRRPVRLLQYPDRALLLHPRGLQRASRQLAAGAGTGFRRLSGRRRIAPSGD